MAASACFVDQRVHLAPIRNVHEANQKLRAPTELPDRYMYVRNWQSTVLGQRKYLGRIYLCNATFQHVLRSSDAELSAFPQSDTYVDEFRNPQRIVGPGRSDTRGHFVAGRNDDRAHQQNLRSVFAERKAPACGILAALGGLGRFHTMNCAVADEMHRS